MIRFFAVLLLCLLPAGAQAGLNLGNQETLYVPNLDLDNDGRILRTEVAEYMFFYFDRDGNESLTKGEYHRVRPFVLVEYDPLEAQFIDINNDGEDDGVVYDTESFLAAVMLNEDYLEEDGIKAYHMMDLYFSRFDTDKSRAIELDEWQKHFQKFANRKPNMAPKAANNDYYAK